MERKLAVVSENLTKTFSGKEIIKNCEIHVERGSIYGLLGANGAGKTTLFKLMLGLLTPTLGNINILGKNIETDRNEILKNIGSIIEVPIFYEHLSASENLKIHLSYMGVKGLDINDTLDMVGLKNIKDQPVSKFSLGMRQRLGIARALVHQPEILILDEPTNGLDPMGIREIRELLAHLTNDKGLTTIISSHILSEIEYVADTIGVMVDGTIIEEVTISNIKERFPNGLEDYFFSIMSGGMGL